MKKYTEIESCLCLLWLFALQLPIYTKKNWGPLILGALSPCLLWHKVRPALSPFTSLTQGEKRKGMSGSEKKENKLVFTIFIKGMKRKKTKWSLSLISLLSIWKDLERKNKMFKFPFIFFPTWEQKIQIFFLSFFFFSLLTFFPILFFYWNSRTRNKNIPSSTLFTLGTTKRINNILENLFS